MTKTVGNSRHEEMLTVVRFSPADALTPDDNEVISSLCLVFGPADLHPIDIHTKISTSPHRVCKEKQQGRQREKWGKVHHLSHATLRLG